MATGDKYRNINPQDCFVTDSVGAIVGVQAGGAAATAARFMTEAQTAAAQAAMPRPGGNAVMRIGGGPNNSGNVTTAWTGTQAWRLPVAAAGFRVGFENISAAQLPAVTLAKYAICGTAGNSATAAMDATANYHSSSPAAFTFDGAAGFTPGLRYSSSRPSAIQWSDWTPLVAADEGKTLVMRMLVPYVADWTYPYTALGFSSYATYLAQITNSVGSLTVGADYVTSNTSWAITSANLSGNLIVPYFELAAKSSATSVLNVAQFGDSISLGAVASGDPSVHPLELACQQLSTTSVKLVPTCRGYSGRTVAESFNFLQRYIQDTKFTPHIVIWQVASQNSNSAAQYQASEGYINAVRQICHRIGAVLILQTAVPYNGLSLAPDNARQVTNTAAIATGEIVINSDATLTDGASPAAYQSAYGAGVHPTIAYYTADVAAQFLPALRRAVAVYGLTV